MEFIKIPLGAEPHVLVLDLGGPEYDRLEFGSYPRRVGWGLDRVISEGLRYTEPNEASAVVPFSIFLQTWLFFGAISLLSDNSISRDRYTIEKIVDGNEGRYLFTQNLLQDLNPHFARLARNWGGVGRPRNRCCEKVLQALRDAVVFLMRFESHQRYEAEKMVPLEVLLHLSICLPAFMRGIDPESKSSLSYAASELMYDLAPTLENDGWCPSSIRRLQQMGNGGLYYLRHLLSANMLDPEVSHDDCTGYAYSATNVDEGAYSTQHTQEDCKCSKLGCDWKEVAKMLDEGEVPVVTIKVSCGISSISLQKSKSQPYVAISHVWSDGLGNRHGNALPVCQLRRLQSWADQLVRPPPSEHSPFWIDTLFVPVQSLIHRWIAIQLIQTTFENSRAVLALDLSLYSIAKPQDITEVAFRIVQCKWMTRLWTFKEAVLANALFMKFQDAFVNLIEIHRQMKRVGMTSLPHDPLKSAYGHLNWALNTLLYLQTRKNDPEACAIHEVFVGLPGRTTSRVTDAPICVAALLGTDVSHVLESSPEQMYHFWLLVKDLPTSILWNSGPKLEQPGFRWAPASLLDPDTLDDGIPITDCALAVPTPIGLQVSGLPGYILRNMFVSPAQKMSIPVKFRDRGRNALLDIRKAWRNAFLPWGDIKLCNDEDPILLMHRQPTVQSHQIGVIAARDQETGSATQSGRIIRILTRVMVYVVSREDSSMAHAGGIDSIEAFGEELSEELEWIVS